MRTSRKQSAINVFIIALTAIVLCAFFGCGKLPQNYAVYEKVTTFAGIPGEAHGAANEGIKEPFALAFNAKGELFISDGEAGKIWTADKTGALKVVSDKLDTPSGLAFDKNDNLYVTDSGSHTIKKVDAKTGETSIVAGVENQPGFVDGDAQNALFNAPIGITAGENGKIFVADTYNDRIRVIENGKVSTIAGGERGFADADSGLQAKFDTPCSITVFRDGGLLVADTGNGEVRLIERSGRVLTLGKSGNDATNSAPDSGANSWANSGAYSAANSSGVERIFAEPMDVKVDAGGRIYVSDAGANTVYVMDRDDVGSMVKLFPGKRGLADGPKEQAAMNRPTGLAIDANGRLFIADSENQLIRVLQNKEGTLGAEIKPEEIDKLKFTAEEMRQAGAASGGRWPYDPPERPREIAGTFGELRGDTNTDETVWFHNGLDIAGGYGETTRFVRSEKVLRPLSAQLFNTLRESLRMPTLGYVHLRLGRDQKDKPFSDPRFLFSFDESGKMSGIRIRRGTKFAAGESIGTLNTMNHVHLIAGRSGNEMNALTVLNLPGLNDSIAPVIEEVHFFDENWGPLDETKKGNSRIKVAGKVRIVVRCYDRMDGNAERRRLGLYRIGYKVLREDGAAVENAAEGASDTGVSVLFDKTPADPRTIYAPGSKSGATGETIFNYIATNSAQGGSEGERFFDTSALAEGNYILRVTAADFFGNEAMKDISISVVR